jgi:mono/diheme cytochrome c family protein
MSQAKVLSLRVSSLLALILIPLFATVPAFGQVLTERFEIPYRFVVGTRSLPAGGYTFSVDKSGLLFVKSDKGEEVHGNIITRIVGPAQLLRHGSLIFYTSEAGRVLSEVWLPGVDGLLLKSVPNDHVRDTLLASDLSPTHAVSGKKAYSLTCGNCHGQDGKGDVSADKFFNTTIPRLSSAEVQAKSDAELKEIIRKGTSTMPPVEVDESGFRHNLPSQDVDAVIAYVRTLK